jgi:thioredoxin 1
MVFKLVRGYIMSLLRLTKENFKEEVLNYEGVVLVDFWAPWCGPCRMIAPFTEELSSEMEGKAKVGKVNVDEESSLGQEYEIMSIPAVFVFKDGKVVERLIGAMNKDSYKEAIEKHL